MKLSLRTLVGLGALVTGMILSPFWVNLQFIQPRVEARELADREIEFLESKIEKTWAAFPSFKSLEEELKKEESAVTDLGKGISLLEEHVLSEKELAALILPTGAQERQRLSNLKSTKTLEKQIGPFIQEKMFISMETDFPSLVAYLSLLETTSAFFRPLSLSMSKDRRTASFPKAEIELLVLHTSSESLRGPEGRSNLAGSEIASGDTRPRNDMGGLATTGLTDPFIYRVRNQLASGLSDKKPQVSEVIFMGENRYAVIDGKKVQEGDRLPGNTAVQEIHSHQVILRQKNSTTVLSLQ